MYILESISWSAVATLDFTSRIPASVVSGVTRPWLPSNTQLISNLSESLARTFEMDGIYRRTWIFVLWGGTLVDICGLAYCIHYR